MLRKRFFFLSGIEVGMVVVTSNGNEGMDVIIIILLQSLCCYLHKSCRLSRRHPPLLFGRPSSTGTARNPPNPLPTSTLLRASPPHDRLSCASWKLTGRVVLSRRPRVEGGSYGVKFHSSSSNPLLYTFSGCEIPPLKNCGPLSPPPNSRGGGASSSVSGKLASRTYRSRSPGRQFDMSEEIRYV